MGLFDRRWFGILAFVLVLSPHPVEAVRGFNERNRFADEKIKTDGFLPVLFNPFTISADNPKWDERVTYEMSRDSAVLVEIKPVKKPVGVIMFVSQSGTATLKAAWSHDHITEPVRFWTHRYWISSKQCDEAGCPRIMFKAIKGTLAVTILDKRP
jgi:hypothetical protein